QEKSHERRHAKTAESLWRGGHGRRSRGRKAGRNRRPAFRQQHQGANRCSLERRQRPEPGIEHPLVGNHPASLCDPGWAMDETGRSNGKPASEMTSNFQAGTAPMLLAPQDVALFFKLHRALMFFVDQRLNVIPDNPANPDEFSSLAPETRLEVRDAFLRHTDLIQA